jgi:hypothetical protein
MVGNEKVKLQTDPCTAFTGSALLQLNLDHGHLSESLKELSFYFILFLSVLRFEPGPYA